MSKVVLEVGKQEIDHNPYRVRLTEGEYAKEFPKNMDISSIKLLNFDNSNFCIEKISIIIGGSEMLRYRGEEINNMVLPEEGILLSRLPYHQVDINFEFNSQFIRDNSTYVDADEYVEEITESDELVEFRNPDTDEIYSGYKITRVRKPTESKIKRCIGNPRIKFPDIEFGIKAGVEGPERIETPFWQKVLITPKDTPWEYVQNQIDKYELHTEDKTVLEYYQTGKPFYAKIKNTIVYIAGMGGLKYGFS
jgi:hypothetical protein